MVGKMVGDLVETCSRDLAKKGASPPAVLVADRVAELAMDRAHDLPDARIGGFPRPALYGSGPRSSSTGSSARTPVTRSWRRWRAQVRYASIRHPDGRRWLAALGRSATPMRPEPRQLRAAMFRVLERFETSRFRMHCSNARTVLRCTRDGELCRNRSVSVGESSDDNLRSARPEPFVPAEAWIEAFDAQCTEAMLKRLRRYVLLLARVSGGEHMGDHASYAEELVQAAVTDLVAGVLRWDPSLKDLESYLTDVIRLRVRRDRKRAARFKHVSIDAAPPSAPGAPIREVEIHLAAGAAAHADESEPSSSDSMTGSMRRLRESFSDDPLALRFLDAIEQDDQDAFTRAEIMKIAGLTRAEYHNTRRRIARYLARFDRDLSTPVRDN